MTERQKQRQRQTRDDRRCMGEEQDDTQQSNKHGALLTGPVAIGTELGTTDEHCMAWP